MNEQNYDYLKNQVKFMGFGEELNDQLLAKIQTQTPEFSLQHQTKFGQDDVSSKLNFEMSKTSDRYFFQNFEMEVKGPKFEDAIKQTYYVGQENNLTLKEHHNMLEGRAVFKTFNRLEQTGEGDNIRFKPTKETYQAWTDLNFKKTDDAGNFEQRKMFGYDLEKSLEKFPLKDLEDNYDKRRLIASLEKGNLTKATVLVDGQEQKVNIAANPRDNTINFYDGNMQRISVKQVAAVKNEVGQDVKQDQQASQNLGQNKADGGKDQSVQKDEEQKTGQRRKQGVRV